MARSKNKSKRSTSSSSSSSGSSSRTKKRVFQDNDYKSGDGMLTTVWGPSQWHFLHTMSFNYPVSPTEKDKENYRNYVLSLRYILPCKYCRENLTKNLEKMPLNMSDMANRESFSKYIYNLHETVNTMLGKKSGLTYDDVRERYEHFRARCTVPRSKNIGGGRRKTQKHKKTTEKGCTVPLVGKKAKCILKIVPQETKCDTIQIDKKCIKKLAY